MTAVSVVAVFLCAIILFLPAVSANGVKSGLILCADVIIPSLFPFCAIALFCQKSGIVSFLANIFSPFSKKVFHQSGEQFCVFLMSFLAGYPIGVRLIKEMYMEEKISADRAKLMSLYCVNAGPAFVLAVVGEGILGDRTLGIFLLISNIIATVFLAVIIERKQTPIKINAVNDNMKIGDAFVDATVGASQSIFGICAWVILFSALLSVIDCGIFPDIVCNAVLFTSEVTTAAAGAGGNVLIISSILSFCGLCVHCQVYSSGKGIMPKYPIFLACRFLHAAISSLCTFILLKLDKRTVETFSNGIITQRVNTSFSYTGAIALMIMCVCLIISVSGNKKYKIP